MDYAKEHVFEDMYLYDALFDDPDRCRKHTVESVLDRTLTWTDKFIANHVRRHSSASQTCVGMLIPTCAE